ncbi:MAG: YjgN family protein [Moraxella sp.]|nr:YjgN family protein [Moraxella sp.]
MHDDTPSDNSPLTAHAAPEVAPPVQFTTPTTHRFTFGGTGSAYFKIWIVNLFLTIITLGFYSPWAKVRRLRYFYGNTEVGGNTFDFTANPKRILIGRIIAVGVYLAISIFGNFSPEIAIIGSLLLFALFPWLIRSTMRFMARNSQYNNIRFGFDGKLGTLYMLCIAILLLNLVSFGLLMPFSFWLFKRYQFDNTYFGRLKFNFNTGVFDFYKAMLLPMMLFIFIMVAFVGIGFSGYVDTAPDMDNPTMDPVFLLMMGVFYLGMLLIIPLAQGLLHKAIWGKLTLGSNRFELVNFSVIKFALINLTNYIAIILSLGLLYPWATVRLHRYKTETLALIAHDDFETLATPSADNVSPIGEEISDVFDFDVSW